MKLPTGALTQTVKEGFPTHALFLFPRRLFIVQNVGLQDLAP
jgi:hypothetical protein